MDILDQVLNAIRRADREAAVTLLKSWADTHGYEPLHSKVLEPLLSRIGHDWCEEQMFSLAQVYVSAKVTEDMLTIIAQKRAPSAPTVVTQGPVILGNIEDDFHPLGRRIVANFLRIDGWEVIDLGNDVPPATFVDTAVGAGARVIGVSAMIMSNALNIMRVREEIGRQGMTGRIQLAVGGAVFVVSPGLVADVGGDGTSSSALGAGKLFSRLWQAAVHHEEVTT